MKCASHFSGILEAKTVILHRAKRGFGFVLRGAKAASPLMQLKPTDRCPGLQYLDDVDPGGVADMAGLSPGDFLLAVCQSKCISVFVVVAVEKQLYFDVK